MSAAVDELEQRYQNVASAASDFLQQNVFNPPSVQLDLRGTEAVPGFIWNGRQEYVENMLSCMRRGDLAGAKKVYDGINDNVRENLSAFMNVTRVAENDPKDPTAVELARRASYFAQGLFNHEKVVLRDGTETTVGHALADPEAFRGERQAAMYDDGFSPEATDLYLQGDAVMKGILRGAPPFGRAAGTGTPPPKNSAALRDFANEYASRRAEFLGVFGAGAQQLAADIAEVHRDAGSAVQTFGDLLAYGTALVERARANGETVDGRVLAREAFAGYRDLLAASFPSEASEKAPDVPRQVTFSPAQQRQFDAVFSPAVRQTLSVLPAGAKLDLHAPLFRHAFAEVQDTIAYISASGGDLFTAARTVGSNVNKAFGDYVASAVTGQEPSPGNIIAQTRKLRADMQARILGGHDMREVAVDLTGRSVDYLRSVPKALGGQSSCAAADAMAVDVQQCLVRGLIPVLAKGGHWGQYLLNQNADAKFAAEIARRLQSHFMGAGARDAAEAVAAAVVSQYVRGDRVVIEDVVTNLAYADKSVVQITDEAQRALRAWHFGNVSAPLRFLDQKRRLVASLAADGLSQLEAQRIVSQVNEMAEEVQRKGGNPLAVYDSAIATGFYFTRPFLRDDKGNVVMSQATGKPMFGDVQRIRGDRRQVEYQDDGGKTQPRGVFLKNPAAWGADQEALRRRFLDEERNRQKVAVKLQTMEV